MNTDQDMSDLYAKCNPFRIEYSKSLYFAIVFR